MKYNLKNPLWKTNPTKAKQEFQKELREKAYVYCNACEEGKSYLQSIENENRCPHCDNPVSEPLIELKEILGE
jgi:transcription initiation factor IIE alpha subunit